MKLLKYLKFWRLPKKILAILLIILIGGGYFFFSNQTKKPVLQTAKVERKDIREVVSTSGILNGKNTAALRFKSSGRLASLNVKTGDKIEKGTHIASLDTQQLSIALQQARNNFTSADATAKRVEDSVKDNDNDENFTQKEERVQAQTARDNAFDAVKEAQRAFQDVNLYSPISGIVIKADLIPGQNVSISDIIATVSDDSGVVFEAEVDETEIGKISLGQMADVTLNSYPDQIFKGTVLEISPQVSETESGATIVLVKIDLGTPTINFVQGLNGDASIILRENKNVLTIPQEALKDNEVIVKDGEKLEKVKVTTDIFSDLDVEITSGLSEGQEIVLNPDEAKL